jgi:hypothetical protein
MLFRFGPPPNSLSDTELASGEWRRLALPPLWVRQVLSVPVGALMALILFVAWVRFTPRFEISVGAVHQVIGAVLFVFVAGMLLQISTYPGMGLTNNTVLGVWPSRLIPYTAHLSEVTKSRAIVSLLLPFAVLALLPVVVVVVTRISSGWLVFGSCMSAGIFGMNAVLAMPVLRLPKRSVVAGRGFQAYWKVVHR